MEFSTQEISRSMIMIFNRKFFNFPCVDPKQRIIMHKWLVLDDSRT